MYTYEVESPNPRTVVLSGSFTLDGSGDPASSGSYNKLSTLTRPGTGDYLITFSEPVVQVLSANVSVLNATNQAHYTQLKAVTGTTVGFFTINASTDAAASLASSTIHYTVVAVLASE